MKKFEKFLLATHTQEHKEPHKYLEEKLFKDFQGSLSLCVLAVCISSFTTLCFLLLSSPLLLNQRALHPVSHLPSLNSLGSFRFEITCSDFQTLNPTPTPLPNTGPQPLTVFNPNCNQILLFLPYRDAPLWELEHFFWTQDFLLSASEALQIHRRFRSRKPVQITQIDHYNGVIKLRIIALSLVVKEKRHLFCNQKLLYISHRNQLPCYQYECCTRSSSSAEGTVFLFSPLKMIVTVFALFLVISPLILLIMIYVKHLVLQGSLLDIFFAIYYGSNITDQERSALPHEAKVGFFEFLHWNMGCIKF